MLIPSHVPNGMPSLREVTASSVPVHKLTKVCSRVVRVRGWDAEREQWVPCNGDFSITTYVTKNGDVYYRRRNLGVTNWHRLQHPRNMNNKTWHAWVCSVLGKHWSPSGGNPGAE